MKRFCCALALLLSPALVAAQPSVGVSITGSTVNAVIELAGGIEAELTIDFETVVGLSVSSIGVSANLVDPLDEELLDRLPDRTAMRVPAAFPMRVEIEPPANGPLSFTGVADIELHTHNLSYVPNSPLRLLAAPLGGAFEDITSWAGSGSHRIGGNKGGFSEFLIIADVRPVDSVIDLKFARLQSILDDNASAIDADVLSDLQAEVDAAWSWRLNLDYVEAAAVVSSLLDLVKVHSGSDIPDVWRSSRDLVNVAGELREAGSTLRYSLNLASSS